MPTGLKNEDETPSVAYEDPENKQSVSCTTGPVIVSIFSMMDEEKEELCSWDDEDSSSKSSSNQAEMVDTKSAVLSNVKEEAESCPVKHDPEDCGIQRSLNINTVTADFKPTILPTIKEKEEDCSVDSEMKGSSNNPVVMADTTPAALSNLKEEAEACPIKHDYEDCDKRRSLDINTVTAVIKPPTEQNIKEKPKDCSVDGQDSATKGSTINLIETQNIIVKESYSCSDCKAKFMYKSTLKKHQRIHRKRRIFACIECEKRFFKKADLIAHQRIHKATVFQDLKMTTVSKPRQTKFSESELQVLAEGVVSAYDRLFGRLVSSTSVHMKKLLWQRITDQINAVAPVVRNVWEVKKRWNDLKRKIRDLLRNHHEACMARAGGPAPVLIMRPWEELTHSVIGEVSFSGLEGMETGMADNFPDDVNADTLMPKHARNTRKRKARENSQMKTTSHSLSIASNSSVDIERQASGSTRSPQVICGDVVVNPQIDQSSVQVPNPLPLSNVSSQNSTSQETSDVINLTVEISPSTSDISGISDTHDQDRVQHQLDHLEVINSTMLEGDNCIRTEAITTINDQCNMDFDQSHEDLNSNIVNKADTAVQTNVTGNIQSINTVIASRLSTLDEQQQTVIENTAQLTKHVKSIDESLKLLVRGQARSQISFNRSMNRLSTSLIHFTKQISNGFTLVARALTQPPRDANIQTDIPSNVLGQMEEVTNLTSDKDETVVIRKAKKLRSKY